MPNKDSQKEFFLPPELLEDIYKRLTPNDRIRFGSVCKAWLNVVISEKPPRSPPLPEPWLMLGHRDSGGYLSMYGFHCLSDNRVYKFNNAVPKDYKVITISSDGWLLTESPCSSHLKLVNPILNHQMRTISPPWNRFFFFLRRWNRSFFDVKSIKKLRVLEPRPTSSAESIDTTFIMLPHPGSSFERTIGYSNCKFQKLFCMVPHYPMHDDIVLYKGELHALIIGRRQFGIHVFDKDGQFYPQQTLAIRGIAPNSQKDEACLVESGGDLLLVRRQPNDLLQTTGFDVFKVATVRDSGDANAVKLQRLGDHQALFWGKQGCFSVPVEESSSFREDHIYFIHTLKEEPLTEEYGSYSLEDGSIKLFNLARPLPSATESFWFFPTVKYTTVSQYLRPSIR